MLVGVIAFAVLNGSPSVEPTTPGDTPAIADPAPQSSRQPWVADFVTELERAGVAVTSIELSALHALFETDPADAVLIVTSIGAIEAVKVPAGALFGLEESSESGAFIPFRTDRKLSETFRPVSTLHARQAGRIFLWTSSESALRTASTAARAATGLSP